jgi:hypothetical protein
LGKKVREIKSILIDVATIGAGTAGASALIIEDGDYGTTHARVGCIPSKLLIDTPAMRRMPLQRPSMSCPKRTSKSG